MNDGRYFYQKMFLPSSIDGTYTFKTSDNKYHLISYSVLRPFLVEKDETTEQNFDQSLQDVKSSSVDFKLEGK